MRKTLCTALLAAAASLPIAAHATVVSTAFAVDVQGSANGGAQSFSSTDNPASRAVVAFDPLSAAAAEGIAEQTDDGNLLFLNGSAAAGNDAQSTTTTRVTQVIRNDTGGSASLFLNANIFAGTLGFMRPDVGPAGCDLNDLFACGHAPGTAVSSLDTTGSVQVVFDIIAEGVTFVSIDLLMEFDNGVFTTTFDGEELLDDFGINEELSTAGALFYDWSETAQTFFLGGYSADREIDVEFVLTTTATTGFSSLASAPLAALSCFGDPSSGGLIGGGGFSFASAPQIVSLSSAASAPANAEETVQPTCLVGQPSEDVSSPPALALLGLGIFGLGLRRLRRGERDRRDRLAAWASSPS